MVGGLFLAIQRRRGQSGQNNKSHNGFSFFELSLITSVYCRHASGLNEMALG
jgi:hypothetical protein